MAVVIGTILALCTLLLIFYVRRNPQKAKKILNSFLLVEVLISVRIGFDGLDFYTESVVQTESGRLLSHCCKITYSANMLDHALFLFHAFPRGPAKPF